MKKVLSIIMIMAMFTTGVLAQNNAKRMVTDLPDISVIGNFVNTHSDAKKSFDVSEVELALQHYLYPDVKANVFIGLHKEDGKHNVELEEAYVTFADLVGTLAPNTSFKSGLGFNVGKKLIGLGKVNPLHPEQWTFVDRPIAITQFFGDHGLSAEGGQLLYALPLPFFSQIELGYWTAAKHEEAEGEAHGVEYSNRLLTARSWNSFALAQDKELQIGLNYLGDNVSNKGGSTVSKDQYLVGIDLTYQQDFSSSQNLALQAEYFQASYGEEGGKNEEQAGGYLSGFYTLNSSYQAGLRYGMLGKHGDEGNVKNQWSVLLTRQLTDTSKFRLQYNTGDNVENTVLAQFMFGFGPHSHVLQ